MNIEEDLKSVIEKSLPSAVGAVLQERLKRAEDDARKVEYLTSEVKTIREANFEHISSNKQLKAQLTAHAALEEREKAVAEREYKVDLYQANVQLEAAKANTQFAKDVALGLVRNVEYRNSVGETAYKQVNNAPVGQYPCWVQGPSDSKTSVTDSLAR